LLRQNINYLTHKTVAQAQIWELGNSNRLLFKNTERMSTGFFRGFRGIKAEIIVVV